MQAISSLPKGQWVEMACFSTSLGVLKAFWHPAHSHKNGKFGLSLGTEVTVKLEAAEVAVEAVEATEATEAVEVTAVGEVVTLFVGELGVGELVPLPLPLPLCPLTNGLVSTVSTVPMTTCVPFGAVLTIICLPSGVVMTFWPPAVVDIEEPSGMTPLASNKAFLGAISSNGSADAGRLPFIFLYSCGSC